MVVGHSLVKPRISTFGKRNRSQLLLFSPSLRLSLQLSGMDSQSDTTQQLVQRLLTRMDHLEYRLIRDTRHDVEHTHDELSQLRSVVGHMQKARKMEAEDSLVANTLAEAPRAQPAHAPARAPAPCSVGHRGPGVEPPFEGALVAR